MHKCAEDVDFNFVLKTYLAIQRPYLCYHAGPPSNHQCSASILPRSGGLAVLLCSLTGREADPTLPSPGVWCRLDIFNTWGCLHAPIVQQKNTVFSNRHLLSKIWSRPVFADLHGTTSDISVTGCIRYTTIKLRYWLLRQDTARNKQLPVSCMLA